MADDRDISAPAPGKTAVLLLERVFEPPPLDNEQLRYLRDLQAEAAPVDEDVLIGGPHRRSVSR